MQRFIYILLISAFCLVSCRHEATTLFELVPSSHTGVGFNNLITQKDPAPAKTGFSYGGGIGVADFNNDGLQDLYFSGNMTSNRLYLNRGNFRFEDITETAGVDGLDRWARGVTVIDINSDGLTDLYISTKGGGLLYINLGNNKEGIPQFKEQSAAYGLKLPLPSSMASFVDYDNDGEPDLYLSENESSGRFMHSVWNTRLNHPVFEEVTAKTLATPLVQEYLKQLQYTTPLKDLIDLDNDGMADQIKLDLSPQDDYHQKAITHNSGYKNAGSGIFTDKSAPWGLTQKSYSSSAVYADLNNDGAMDLVVSNLNDEAFIYRNTVRDKDLGKANFIQFKFIGSAHNTSGLGTRIKIWYDHGKHQDTENNPYRSYLASDQNVAHFGLGQVKVLDSAVINWPSGRKQVMTRVKANQFLIADFENAH